MELISNRDSGGGVVYLFACNVEFGKIKLTL